jgi:hypothetical protein
MTLLTPYMVTVGCIDTGVRRNTGERMFRDVLGSLYRLDGGTPHLEEPALKEPSFGDFRFSSAWRSSALGLREEAATIRSRFPHSFTMIEIM